MTHPTFKDPTVILQAVACGVVLQLEDFEKMSDNQRKCYAEALKQRERGKLCLLAAILSSDDPELAIGTLLDPSLAGDIAERRIMQRRRRRPVGGG